MEIGQVVRGLVESEAFAGRIAHERLLPAREPVYGEPDEPLTPEVGDQLRRIGVARLYAHQAEAINRVRAGAHVMVVSGTASGKSLCYHIPILERRLREPKSRALLLFPTKALAQDQLRVLGDLEFPGTFATYDGDTPVETRAEIRRNAMAVLSNPDMLHTGILPHHSRWANFFLNLRYVVLDEVHALRGVFGSNVALTIRRLRRACDHYGSKPQFILASATIANPASLASRLLGLDVEVVEDGAPRSARRFLLWNPPIVDTATGRRASSNRDTAALLAELVRRSIRSIVFSKSRKAAELIAAYAAHVLEDRPDLKSRLASYRAGYLASQRREIERRLFGGELTAVSATSALELGIDVGTLDAAIVNGFPGTITSLWQQVGRAGRTERESLAVLVAGEDPLDQYYVTHPEYLFGRPFEEAIIDPDNPLVMARHLLCAAFELPLVAEDRQYFGEPYAPVVEELERVGDLKRAGGPKKAGEPKKTGEPERAGGPKKAGELKKGRERWFPVGRGFPADKVNLRSASRDEFAIVEAKSGSLLGTADANRAFHEVHPGAIYLHQGEPYLVADLDLAERTAFVKPADVGYYTQTREDTDITVEGELVSRSLGTCGLHLGRVEVTTIVLGFQRKRVFTGETLGFEELSLPPRRFRTEALWLVLPDSLAADAGVDAGRLPGAIHALEHAGIAMLPFFAMCDRWDIGGVSTPLHLQTERTTIFIYDGYEGGVGIARRGYQVAEDHLRRTLEAITTCPCEKGCPSCVQSPKCGNWNEPLDKEGAALLLNRILSLVRSTRGAS